MVKKIIIQKGEYIRFKKFERIIKPTFMVCAHFEVILVPEDEMQNPDESYTNKYHKHVACSYGDKLLRADDTFRKPFK